MAAPPFVCDFVVFLSIGLTGAFFFLYLLNYTFFFGKLKTKKSVYFSLVLARNEI